MTGHYITNLDIAKNYQFITTRNFVLRTLYCLMMFINALAILSYSRYISFFIHDSLSAETYLIYKNNLSLLTKITLLHLFLADNLDDAMSRKALFYCSNRNN